MVPASRGVRTARSKAKAVNAAAAEQYPTFPKFGKTEIIHTYPSPVVRYFLYLRERNRHWLALYFFFTTISTIGKR